ncbi:hypothetical protein Glove_138g49 [Diversispora epigaea]|uniref:histidine kinase n=1 Tax=Diversispora epigaea TaxID=1348612 RepID=A0A397IWB7_9GLOM|nr:hypothetical protein Glove_138g49 [Diversispora epigaea]
MEVLKDDDEEIVGSKGKIVCENWSAYMSLLGNEDIGMDTSNPYSNEQPIREFVYSFDWGSTALGPIDSWPPCLKSTVDLCLHSRFPMAIFYGSEKNIIYNEMYRPILKQKHPSAMGQPMSEVWFEIYDFINRLFNQVTATGKGSFEDDCLLFTHRDGYTEECYFSFTFSPIFTEDGSVGGVFVVVQETTKRILTARRLKTLGELGKKTTGAKSIETACHLVASTLQDNKDIPFAMMYLIESNAKIKTARLIATTFDQEIETKIGENNELHEMIFVEGKSKRELPDYLLDTNLVVNLEEENEGSSDSSNRLQQGYEDEDDNNHYNYTSWPLNKVNEKNHIIITLKNGSKAILLPISTSFAGKTLFNVIMICGINQHRALDREYMEFLQLAVSHVSSSLTHGRSREEERKQTEILADLNRQKIMFFQNISHEFRTPLTLMLSPLEESIKQCPPDCPILSNLQLINRNSNRLLKLVNTLLQFSRIEANRLEAQFRETDIVKYTLELVSCFESMAKSLKLDYFIEIPTCKEFYSELKNPVFVDRDMYEKIIFNICSNAFKHTWTGNITVRLYPDHIEGREIVVLEISDTGVGISEENIPKLFQRFNRIEASQSRSHEGTGIGLALVKELVHRHGGKIIVESEIKKGTTFRIWIPTGLEHLPRNQIYFLKDEEEDFGIIDNVNKKLFSNKDLYLEESKQWIQECYQENDTSTNSTATENETCSNNDNNNNNIINNFIPGRFDNNEEVYHVLVVDDNTDMRNYLGTLLSKEFKVQLANDGRDALRIIQKNSKLPDLILSDILMPNMNGIELLNSLRSNSVTQMIPVILLSAKAGENDSVRGLEKGADDYLIKPFSARELIARVRVNIKLSCLRNQLLFQQKRQTETNQLLFSITSKIRSGFNMEETLDTAVKEIHRILPCDRIFITEADSDIIKSRIRAFSATDRNELNRKGQYISYCKEMLNGILITSKSRVLIDNNKSSTDLYKDLQESIKKLSTCEDPEEEVLILDHHFCELISLEVNSIGIPINVNSSIWGWVTAHRPSDSIWTEPEKMILQQITSQIGLAIAHALLLEEKLKREAQMEAAKAANEAKSRILANTSHELRTPLGAIIGVLSAFEETQLTEEQRDMVQIMSRASDVVLSVVNDILDAAKLEAQKISLMNRTFDLIDLIEKTIEIFGEKAGKKQIELILCVETALPKYVKSDPERFQQILMNLLSNSVKFTESGEIVLKISMTSFEESLTGKGTLYIELIDTGIGIDQSFMEDIWESFSQGDPSLTRVQDGTGLGLSICKNLVTINGGELGVTSELRKGSRFWFTWNVDLLPLLTLSSSDSQSTNTNDSFDIKNHLTSTTARAKRILVIDPVALSRTSLIKFINESVERIDAFDTSEKGINAAKEWEERNRNNNNNNNSIYDIVFFNLREDTIEDVKNGARKLRKICGEDLCIVLLVFWSAEHRALGQKITKEIGGRISTLSKPVMQKRLLDFLRNNDIFKSSPSSTTTNSTTITTSPEINIIKPFADLAAESFYQSRRSSISTNYINNVTIKSKDNNNINKKADESKVPFKRTREDQSHESKSKMPRLDLKSECILCVEDNPVNLKVILHQLSKLGYRTLSAINGQEALNLIEKEFGDLSNEENFKSASSKISLILMDCMMPIMSGYDAAKALRSMKPPISEIPIIALTASAIQGSREKCLESGMDDFLTKPLKMGQLKEMLNQCAQL